MVLLFGSKTKQRKKNADLRDNCVSQKQRERLGSGKTLKSVAKHEELELESNSPTKALLTSEQIMQLISTVGFSFNQSLNISQCAPKQ